MIELPVHVTSDEVHAHPRHTGRGWLDLLLALSAIFISVVSLAVAIEHGRIDRQLVAANSWPFLEIKASIGDHTGVLFQIVNEGIGPAKLESFQVLLDGKPVSSSLDLLQRCCGVSTDASIRARQLPNGIATFQINNAVFRAGDTRPFIDIPHQPAAPGLEARLVPRLGSLSFRACYCSVFDECWRSRLTDLHPTPVAACPVSEPSFNQDIRPE